MSLISGYQAEDQACVFLEKKGLKCVCKNYRSPGGEIDLVMKDQNYYVFVEVRLRQNPNHGNAEESVTLAKQKRIIKSALHYLQKKRLFDRADCRFDVIAMDGGEIRWIRNAFEVPMR